MKEFSKYIGLDVHKETIAVSVAEARGGEVRYVGEIANTPEAMEKLVRQLRKGGASLSFCYEAGPCGYLASKLRGSNSAARLKRPMGGRCPKMSSAD